jgi:hypothetical protein
MLKQLSLVLVLIAYIKAFDLYDILPFYSLSLDEAYSSYGGNNITLKSADSFEISHLVTSELNFKINYEIYGQDVVVNGRASAIVNIDNYLGL